MDVVTSAGELTVSVCTQRCSQNEEHWLVMMEVVERVSAFLSFTQDVSISSLNSRGSVILSFSFLL